MIRIKDLGKSLGLAILASLLIANVTFANEAAKAAKDVPEEGEDVENADPGYPITGPASRSTLSTEILGKMRTKLMGVMGIEPDDAEAPDAKKAAGH